MRETVALINNVGNRVFYNPSPLLPYDELVGKCLASNTYRGFHKIEKAGYGSKYVFEKILSENSDFIVKSLNEIQTERDLDQLANQLCDQLFVELKKYVKNTQLYSFNKLRKPVDIIIQHMVSMASELQPNRSSLVELLFLPLDSQIFQSSLVFNDDEIQLLGLKRSFSFKSITNARHYYDIQDFLKKKAISLGIERRIFFDLVWNDRYRSSGTNLLGTNPR